MFRTRKESPIERKEELLSNAAFQRFAGCFELYQTLLAEAGNEEERRQIIARMRDVYKSRMKNSTMTSVEIMHKMAVLKDFVETALGSAEQGKFSAEQMTDMIISSDILLNDLAGHWNPKPGVEKDDVRTYVTVNQVVAYNRIRNGDEISMSIIPTPVSGSQALTTEIVNGFSEIAGQLKTGELQVEKITMDSWLFSPELEPRARALLGKDVQFIDLPDDNEDVVSSQYQALTYNKRSLQEYLKTGKKPVVRRVEMTKEEFISRFSD